MRRILFAGVVLVGAGAAFVLWPTYSFESEVIPGAEVHLPFDGTLTGNGRLALLGEIDEGSADYINVEMGQALWSDGDGRSVAVALDQPIRFPDKTEVSLRVMAEDWRNSYAAGSAVQTVAVLTGRRDGGLHHLVLNVMGPDLDTYEFSFEDLQGDRQRLRSDKGAVSHAWQGLALNIDRNAGTTQFLVDERPVAEVEALPRLLEEGVIRLRFGTWFQQNQAFRGGIDRFVIRNADAQ